MKEQNSGKPVQDPLDIPSEAARDKHINFRTGDEDTGGNEKDSAVEERRKQWREGLEEGRRNSESSNR